MAGFETRGKRPANFHRRSSDRGFFVVMVISGLGLIILSLGMGVGISPEMLMFAAP